MLRMYFYMWPSLVKQMIERNKESRELSALTIDHFLNRKPKQIYLPSGNQRPAVFPRCQPYSLEALYLHVCNLGS